MALDRTKEGTYDRSQCRFPHWKQLLWSPAARSAGFGRKRGLSAAAVHRTRAACPARAACRGTLSGAGNPDYAANIQNSVAGFAQNLGGKNVTVGGQSFDFISIITYVAGVLAIIACIVPFVSISALDTAAASACSKAGMDGLSSLRFLPSRRSRSSRSTSPQ